LFLSQEDNLTDALAASGQVSTSKKSYDEIPAPAALLTCPPLAYLLNAIIAGLNIVRDCPLPTLKSYLVKELDSLNQSIVVYLVKQSKYLAAKNAKYLVKSSANKSLDTLYASSYALHFLPHVLLCLETLYPHTKAGSNRHIARSYSTAEIASMFGSALTIQRGVEHRDLIGKDLFAIQQFALDKFLDAELLPKELRFTHSAHLSTPKHVATPPVPLPTSAVAPPVPELMAPPTALAAAAVEAEEAEADANRVFHGEI
jgi:hypothetical protein